MSFKKFLAFAPLAFGTGYCLGLLLNDSQKRTVIAAEELVFRSVKSVSRWIWCKSIDYSKALLNPVPSTTTADQDSSPKTPDGDEITAETRHVSPHFLTKIESFSLLSEYGIEKYETRIFEAGGYKWRLIIYPDGKESQDKGNHVSVYLAMADTSSLPVDWEFNASFTIFLYNQISDNYLCYRVNGRRFNETKSTWGFPKLVSKKKLRDQSNGYLIDDYFVLGAEIFVYKRQRVIESVTLHKPPESPQKREWKIQEFSKLGKDPWFSEEFAVRDVNWKVVLYPNGYSKSKGRAMSMFMSCVSAFSFAAHQKVKAEFNLGVKGWSDSDSPHNSRKMSEWFTSSATGWGQGEFVALDDLRGILVDDCLTLEVEIFVQLVVQ